MEGPSAVSQRSRQAVGIAPQSDSGTHWRRTLGPFLRPGTDTKVQVLRDVAELIRKSHANLPFSLILPIAAAAPCTPAGILRITVRARAIGRALAATVLPGTRADGGQRGFHRAPAEGTRERHDFRQRPGPVGEPWFHGGGGVCPCGRTAEGVRAASFWDRENRALFTAVGALAAADFCATRANLTSGGRELNPVTRVFSGSTPGLATN